MQVNGFQWDDGNLAKCQKHGVSVAEIEALFSSGTLVLFADPFVAEERLRGIGISARGRHIFVVWTLRQAPAGLLIRPISARYMHQKEVDYYEQVQR